MSTTVPDLPVDRPESLTDDLVGMFSFFIDPDGAARRLFRKWFWVGPIAVLAILTVASGTLLRPIMEHVLEVAPVPPNMDPAQYQKSMSMAMKLQSIFIYLAPITVALVILVRALVLFAGAAIVGAKAKFLPMFNLAAGTALIATGLTGIASLIILKAKGEVSTMAEMQPALGIDILLPEGTNKFLVGFLAYFSIFEIWAIVMTALIISSAFRVSKGKGFAAVLPLIVVGLLLRVVSAAFQR